MRPHSRLALASLCWFGTLVAIVAMVAIAASPVAAQAVTGPPGPRRALERDHEIRLARSAAPRSISGNATIFVFENGRYVVALHGTTVFACYVSRSWPQSLEPHCFDAEGARTIMRMEMLGVEFAHAGVSSEEAKRRFEAGIADGTYPLPRRPAMSWMMSSAQELYSDDGRPVGAWQPHIMVYYPNLEVGMLGTGRSDMAAGMLTAPGTPTSNIMIVVPKAVDPEPPGAGRP